MENASLTDELSQLVLSGIDEKKVNIFDQAKRSMRQYLGSTKTGLSVKEKLVIKEEAFNTEHEYGEEEAMYTYNNRRLRGGRTRFSPRPGGGRGRHDQQQKSFQGKSTAQTRARFNRNTRTLARGGARRRETNPLDDEGYPMTCNICGSIFHFSGRNGAGCPESYENLQTAYVTNEQGKK